MLRRTVCTGIFVCALLGLPHVGHAGLIEFIWEMSGPQFIGGGFGCTFDERGVRQDCRAGTAVLPMHQRRPMPRGPFFFVGGELLVSTGKNAGGTDYRFGQAWRAAFTPGLSVRSFNLGRVPVYQGAGVTWDLLFGQDFRAFDKFGLTVTPAEFVFRDKYSVAVKMRIYPNGYTADEFGFGTRQDINRPAEVAWGVGFSYLFRR